MLDKITDWLFGAKPIPLPVEVGRNELCHCGSGLKYKRCCIEADKKLRATLTAANCCSTSS